MIHYLLLLRPVTFQHEPPPPSPPSSFHHYPRYQQHPKVNPTKPQKPQRKEQTSDASRLVARIPSSQPNVKSNASGETLQKCCDCLNYVVRENKQSTGKNHFSHSSSTRQNRNNLWEARKSQEQSHPIISIDSEKCKRSKSLLTSKGTPLPARQTSSLSNRVVANATPPKTTHSSSSKIKSISYFEKSGGFSSRKILSTFRKLHFPFTLSASPSPRRSLLKKQVLREESEDEEEERGVESGKYSSGKQIPTSESNHHQREKEKWKGTSSSLSVTCNSNGGSNNNTVVVETNKLVKRSITVKSSTTISSSSKPGGGKELDCLESLNRNAQASTRQQKKGNCSSSGGGKQDETANGNCSNINNNNRKKSSKNFEKLKKFLLFCKGLRKKSK